MPTAKFSQFLKEINEADKSVPPVGAYSKKSAKELLAYSFDRSRTGFEELALRAARPIDDGDSLRRPLRAQRRDPGPTAPP